MENGYKYIVAIVFMLLAVSIMFPLANAMPKGVAIYGSRRTSNWNGSKTTRSDATSLTTDIFPCSIITVAVVIIQQINFMPPITLSRSGS
uniref:Transmembrane protein n=1 Tax=Anopheles funestus TaxID=62324 RepID=A0A182S3H1_ANOFN